MTTVTIMTREEFQASRYFNVDQTAIETLARIHGLTKEEVEKDLMQVLESEYQFYVDQQTKRILSVEC